jgi:ketosteroid isomerase-like protein
MKQLLLILPLVLLFCFTFSCQKAEDVAEEPAVDMAAEEAAVREAYSAMSKSGPAKDADLFLSYCADDIISAAGILQDKEGVREFYTDWFSKGNYWANDSIDKIVLAASGDLALVIYSYERFWVEDGETKSVKGTDDMTWKKQEDGTWKILAF